MGAKLGLGPSDISGTQRAHTRSYSNEMCTAKDNKKPLVLADSCFFDLLGSDLLERLFKLLRPVDAYLLQFCNAALRSAALGGKGADGTRRSMHRKPEKLEGYESPSVYELMGCLGALPRVYPELYQIACHKNIALLQSMRDKKKARRECIVCSEAAREGQLEVLKWARKNGCAWNGETCAMAASSGHFEVLQWAWSNGCRWNAYTCAFAARRGDLEVLMWARENGCEWDSLTCMEAAENGHLHVLQWARANRCPCKESTCAAAASYGHLHILQWARANGCPWDERTRWYSRAAGHYHILRWALDNGCP